jgi:hypothetical protein
MKKLFCYWWTGMMLIGVGSLSRGMFATIDLLEPDLVAGQRPFWWRITSVAIGIFALMVAPILVRYAARQIVRSEGWLGSVCASKEVTPKT